MGIDSPPGDWNRNLVLLVIVIVGLLCGAAAFLKGAS